MSETITLPLAEVMRWRTAYAMGDTAAESRALRIAIDAALWQPEPGVAYTAGEHWPPADEWVLVWSTNAQRWIPLEAGDVHNASWFWMLMPPAPEVQP